MITNALQKRIHSGDRDAFLEVYHAYGHEVYGAVFSAMRSHTLAKQVVKQAFLSLFDEMLTATDDIDIPASVRRLADREVAMQRLMLGEGLDAPQEAPADAGLPSARVAFSAKEGFATDLPPLIRDTSFRRPAQALYVKRQKQSASDRPKQSAGAKVFVLILVLALFWMLAGVLMKLGYLPAVDLGYGWFNRTVYPFFTAAS
ncbi:MAG: hypothetical protein R2912_06005 [Eubacteriales bacterium]